MDEIKEDLFSGLALDHLGLVASQIDKLGIIEYMDQKLPLTEGSGFKVSMGERVAAMILNGLGFVDSRLYIFPEFLEKKPIERLFGKNLSPNLFNDDSLGRCLDEISKYGTTKLFTEFSFNLGLKNNLLGKTARFDTSTLQLYGEYANNEENINSSDSPEDNKPIPARGFSKSKRHDLKQMVINLATTGKANFPIWMESHSGNASDKKVMPKAAAAMQELCKSLQNAPEFIYAGDSALYSNILPLSNELKWLTRVPNNILQAKKLLETSSKGLQWVQLTNGYKYYLTESNYKNVAQRWVLIFSEHAYKREVVTLERNIDKELVKQEKLWKKISQQLFSCKEDAKNAAKKLRRNLKFHSVNYNIKGITGYSCKGRPTKEAELKVKGYKIIYTLEKDHSKIASVKGQKGKFILSTNELDEKKLASNQMLSEYKAQSGTESGFKFIKNDSFQVDSIFLKNANRIDALMMIMTLCLMVYGFSQYTLRESLAATKETIPNQKRKETSKPTMEWVYFLFLGVHELSIKIGEQVKKIVINVKPVLKKIIKHFGKRAEEIYLNPAGAG